MGEGAWSGVVRYMSSGVGCKKSVGLDRTEGSRERR